MPYLIYLKFFFYYVIYVYAHCKKEKLLFRRPVSKPFLKFSSFGIYGVMQTLYLIYVFFFSHMLQEQFQLNLTDMKEHEH